ncbi:MAG: type I restriction endonuclease subunit R [Candidatus Gastranaerophilales bacterium]|nr:type I restriction endonuclease subunit R [Candidatus Gastranaerophilales bacterium]
MAHTLSEEALEKDLMKQCQDKLDYELFDANFEKLGAESTFGRQTTEEVIFPKNLKEALHRLNPELPQEAIDNAFYELTQSLSNKTDIAANKFIYELVKNGIKVQFKDNNGIDTTDIVKVIDFTEPENPDNEFLFVRQFKISGEHYNCRADLILFINGLPLVFIELKASHKHIENAFYDNITHYKREIPQVFWYNAFIIVSNGDDAKIGTISSKWEHFSDWKKINNEGEKGIISLDTLMQGACSKKNVLDLIENFTLFQEVKGGTIKILGKNHQYLGVNSAIKAFNDRKTNDGKLGVFWHTQGSGKSFSMAFFVQKILRKIKGNWTFLVVTDRTDLDEQIYKNFVSTGVVTEQNVQAESKAHLKQLLREDHRTIFTMIQKFGTEEKGQAFEKLSDRDDIIIITDEAHRTQYGSLAMNMREALPNAAFIAFTGTPLMKDDEKTKWVFGDYISKYTFKQSIEDKATVPLYYEPRIPSLQIINDDLEKDIQNIIKEADLTEEQEERFEKEYVNMYQVITREDRLDAIAKDVVEHFMNRGYMGKAMYVAVDKATAVKMYDKVKVEWKKYIKLLENKLKTCSLDSKEVLQEKIKFMKETDMAVVVSPTQNEAKQLKKKDVDIMPHRIRMNKEDLATKFKTADDKLRLVFVCAMWVTGFDCPTISTLYLDKILKDHTLMQTIARANRISENKYNGLIVDYIGIFKALQKALAIYGEPGDKPEDDSDPAETKLQLLQLLDEYAQKMQKFYDDNKINIEDIFNASAMNSIALLKEAANIVLSSEKTKNDFIKLSQDLKKLFKAVLPDSEAKRYAGIVFVSSILYAKIKESTTEYTNNEEIKELAQKVEELLNKSITLSSYEIKSGDLFDLSKVDFEELQRRILKEKQTTLLEKLRNSISQRIEAMMRLNKFRKEFQEKFEILIEEYNNGKLTMEQFYVQLVALSNNLTSEERRHLDENLSEEELAILDILTKPEPKLNKKEFELVKQAAQTLLASITKEKLVLDWRKKQSTRAKVKETIEIICDETLPEIYGTELFKIKCNNLYEHFYDNYNNSFENIYKEIA